MKKLFALMLALCLMLCSAALADNSITWEEVAPTLEGAGIEGQFYTFEQIAVKIWIPNGMSATELPNENYIGYFAAEDGDAVAVMYADVEIKNLDDYAVFVAENGGANVETGTVNGLPCITYEFTSDAGLCQVCSFTTEAGYILEVAVGPLPDDNAKMGAGFVLASIQAAE